MKVSYQPHEVDAILDRVTCRIGDATVEVRSEGERMVILIQNAKVEVEPRAAGLVLHVEEK